MRYLVVVPPDRAVSDARFHDVDSDLPLAVGDEVLVDDLLMRVHAAIDVPLDEDYDATLVCVPE